MLLVRSLASALLLMLTAAHGVPGTPRTELPEEQSGFLTLIWSDPEGSSPHGGPTPYLVDADGRLQPLEIPAAVAETYGGLLALDRRRVTVTGARAAAKTGASLRVASIRPAAEKAATPVPARERWLCVLVRFEGEAGDPPKTPEFVERLMRGPEAPSMSHYWRELSYGRVGFEQTDVVGWYTLPHGRSYYFADRNDDGREEFDLDRAAVDGFAVVDPDVHLPDYRGVSLLFDGNLGGSWGGGYASSRDGVHLPYGITWLSDWGWLNQAVLAHELGHAQGLPHSTGPYGAVYDSGWDVMSATGANCEPQDPDFGCVAVHTIGVHKGLLGWIPPDRRFVAPKGRKQAVVLDALAAAPSEGAYLLALVPIDDSGRRFYSLEARRRVGYDARLRREGVIIHKIDLGLGVPAQVVDASNNRNPYDNGAVWRTGERFRDAENKVTVAVGAATENGYTVLITRGRPDAPTCPSEEVAADRWKGEYFGSFWVYGTPLLTRDDGTGPLDLAWGAEGPAPGCGFPATNYGVRWTRSADFDEGVYRFSLETDYGILLWVDGKPLLHDRLPGDGEYAVDVPMSAGTHTVTVEYIHYSGNARVRASWVRVDAAR